MSAVLEIRNLNKSFGGIRVANDINLSLHAGRVLSEGTVIFTMYNALGVVIGTPMTASVVAGVASAT